MDDLGQSICVLRKSKGLTQEKLADSAQINLRTLQRIEKGHTNPHGETLKRIADALEVPMDELMEHGPKSNMGYIKAMHFSTLAFVVLPPGNIILPLILWLVRKNNVKHIDFYAKNLLNFQITWTIVFALPYVWFIINRFFDFSISTSNTYLSPWTVLIIYVLSLYMLNIIYVLVVAITLKDRMKNHFPIALQFIR
nr:helix-turn-helix domain-containing protein [Allomuricauda sp.]